MSTQYKNTLKLMGLIIVKTFVFYVGAILMVTLTLFALHLMGVIEITFERETP